MFMKVVAGNRRARFDYEILESFEAGMVLTGPEAKSCRAGHASLAGAYVSFRGPKAVLRQMNISAYPFAKSVPHEPLRDRVLLLNQNELDRLRASLSEKGLTVIPLELKAGKFIKIVIAIGKGRKRIDKRRAIKEREVKRNLREGREV